MINENVKSWLELKGTGGVNRWNRWFIRLLKDI